MFSKNFTDRSSTATISYPPNNHWLLTKWPRWYFLFSNLDLSISIIFLMFPNFWWFSINEQKTNLQQKDDQSTLVGCPIFYCCSIRISEAFLTKRLTKPRIWNNDNLERLKKVILKFYCSSTFNRLLVSNIIIFTFITPFIISENDISVNKII